MTNPQPLGLKKSFGFGDRLGLATPGHLDAARKYDFAPIFAQQSIREMERTQRSADEVMNAARSALAAENYGEIWGADADHLKTPADVELTANAGFCFFTIDPSAHVNNGADAMSESELEANAAQLVAEGLFAPDWMESFEDLETDAFAMSFEREGLLRAVAKYGRAVAHCETMSRAIEATGKPFEIEVSVDETDEPTSPQEHAFFALELKRRGVKNLVSLAPRFVGDMEKGIDYRGDLEEFEDVLEVHVAIARALGPYKISVHSGSDKFSIYPIVGRVCGDLLHVKTAGTSYLEALRVAARANPQLLRAIYDFSRDRFATDRASYHISTSEADVAALAVHSDADLEPVLLDSVEGRQLMHVTFGSVLTHERFQPELLQTLRSEAALHREFLDTHFSKHLSLLNAG